jgi:signal transduction histidine kinase/CheY-like chemotaxis protein
MNQNNSKVHDLKEISKRSLQLVTAALFIGIINCVLTYIQGYFLSAITTSSFCVYLAFILFLHKRGYIRYTKVLSLFGFNAFILALVVLEGLQTGSYLYFIALIFAIPYLIDNNKKYNKEVVFYCMLTTLLFASCIFLSPPKSSLQIIADADLNMMFKTNSLSTVVLCALFAYLSIRFERKYAAALMEEKTKAENAMKARTQFLSHMGHELRTPLNGIIGATNLLGKKTILQEQQEEFTILKYCSTHMLDLINNILDYNKIEAGKLELHPVELNLKKLLYTSTLPFYNRFEEKDVSLQIDIDNRLDALVLADDIRLVQIINNLLSNALKFTEKGAVCLRAICEEQSPGHLRVSFSVEDTGIGIKKEDFDKVFASFGQVYSESTRQYEGTGLGVSICQRLLYLMNSRLEMKSEFMKGSIFSFSVQFERVLKTEKPVALINDAVDLKGMKILLAEDNVINMMIARKTLMEWKANLLGVENGLLALQALEKNSSFDLILLDLEMPVMDGYTAIKEIKARYPHLPVLAFTAALIDQDMLASLKASGFEDALLKPFQPMELFSKIRRYLNVENPLVAQDAA